MQINRGPRDHRYGTYWDRIPECMPRHIPLADLGDFSIPRKERGVPSREEFPYPVVPVTDQYQLHLFPAPDHIRPMLVRLTDGEVLTDGHEPYGFWLTVDGIAEARGTLIAQAENYTNQTAPRELGTALQDALATDELLHDIFSEQLTEKLRPPTVRWLRDHTKSVSADTVEYTGGAYVKTEWTIELEPESNREERSPRTLEFHTDDLIQQDSQRFTVDYRQLFRQQIRCSNTWWTDLSRYWITSATVEDIVDDDYPTEDESAFSLRQSGKAKYHLVRNETGTTVCGHEARSGDIRQFSPNTLPMPAALCNHCSREIKRHLIPRE